MYSVFDDKNKTKKIHIPFRKKRQCHFNLFDRVEKN